MTLTLDEQETIVRWDRGSDTLTVFTHSETAAKRLELAGATVKYRSVKTKSVCLEMPKSWFRWPRPKSGRKGNPEALRKARQDRILAERP